MRIRYLASNGALARLTEEEIEDDFNNNIKEYKQLVSERYCEGKAKQVVIFNNEYKGTSEAICKFLLKEIFNQDKGDKND